MLTFSITFAGHHGQDQGAPQAAQDLRCERQDGAGAAVGCPGVPNTTIMLIMCILIDRALFFEQQDGAGTAVGCPGVCAE